MEIVHIIGAYAIALWTVAVMYAPELVGFLLPPLIEGLNRNLKTDAEKHWMSFMVCFVAALLLRQKDWVTGEDPMQVLLWLGVVYTECTVLYKIYFKGSNMQGFVRKLVRADATPSESMATPLYREEVLPVKS